MGVVPASQVQIDDVWHVSGLKGTSSNDIVVSDLFIPDEWTGTFAELPKIARHPLDQRQLGARFGSEFAAVAIGIAQAALDDITDIARNKIPATSRSKLAQDPVAQYMTGQLATDLYMARTLLHQVARDDQASVASARRTTRRRSSGAPACPGRRRWPRRSSRAPTASPAPPGCSSPARCSGGCATCAPSPSTTCCPPAARSVRSAPAILSEDCGAR